MKIVNDIKQGSAEWLSLRCGKFTASECHKLMGAKGFCDTGESYIYQVASSQITGKIRQIETFATQRGKELEPIARCYYEGAFKQELETCAFMQPEWSNKVGCSPDGFYRIEGKGYTGIEIKCPEDQSQHLKYLTIRNSSDLKDLKKEYYWQIQMCLLISEFERWEFVTFHPDYPKNLIMQSVEIKRNESDILLLKDRLLKAIELKNQIIKSVTI